MSFRLDTLENFSSRLAADSPPSFLSNAAACFDEPLSLNVKAAVIQSLRLIMLLMSTTGAWPCFWETSSMP